MINLDEYEPIGTNWIALYMNDENILYFDRNQEIYLK